MLKEERHNIILEEIRAKNKVHSADLSQQLNVSEDTIRRDLRELSENGHLKKVHGGAMANPHVPDHIRSPEFTHRAERIIIAKKATAFVQDHQVLILEGDATSELLVEQLPSDLRATIFTNSPAIAMKLFRFHSVETFLLGGKISHRACKSQGLEVINTLKDIHADLCIFSALSIHGDIGIMDEDREYAITLKTMMQSASRSIALCLSNHIGRIKPFKVESITNINTLITEIDASDDSLENIRSKGVDIQ
ncbi:MAG: DeoR/GlpR family DNA-binding transcription regulator [Bacteroidota bacterium]